MHKFCYEEEKIVMKQRGPGNKNKQMRLTENQKMMGKDFKFEYIQFLPLKFHPEVA